MLIIHHFNLWFILEDLINIILSLSFTFCKFSLCLYETHLKYYVRFDASNKNYRQNRLSHCEN